MFYWKVFSSLSIMFQLKSATVSSESLPAFISTRNLKCNSVKNTFHVCFSGQFFPLELHGMEGKQKSDICSYSM